MVMGSFPVQSCTSCAEEWIRDGETGILVSPEDTEVVEMAIRRALSEDALVNQAAEKNYRVAEDRLEQKKLKAMTIEMYRLVARK
jgi:glycosyltransferase involved in cell wall biosynthesis